MAWAELTSREKIDAASKAVRQELTPEYISVLRQLREGVRAHQAFELWRMARAALYRQGLERGLSPEDAMRDAARRMLELET